MGFVVTTSWTSPKLWKAADVCASQGSWWCGVETERGFVLLRLLGLELVVTW
jgi:hypothetical protein